MAGSVRCGAVEVVRDQGLDHTGGRDAALVVFADGADKDDKLVFIGFVQADLGARAKQERTDVHGAA